MEEEEIAQDICRVGRKLGKAPRDCFSKSDYHNNGGRVSHYFLYLNGRNWAYYCGKAGYSPDVTKAPVPDEVYYERLHEFITAHGRLPKTSERKPAGLNFAKSRWSTLNLFLQDAARNGRVPVHLATRLFDFLVCWENRWTGSNFPKPVIELKSMLSG